MCQAKSTLEHEYQIFTQMILHRKLLTAVIEVHVPFWDELLQTFLYFTLKQVYFCGFNQFHTSA